jgi:hypothetical protein
MAGGKPIACMQSWMTTKGIESKHAARSVRRRWRGELVSIAFSMAMFIISIALWGLRPFRVACCWGGIRECFVSAFPQLVWTMLVNRR